MALFIRNHLLINYLFMKRTNTFLVLIAFLLGTQFAFAQDGACYLEEVYSEIQVTENVVYGVNATVLALPQVGEAIPQPLTMDVYEPVDGGGVDRPLALVFHTGNFLPNVLNGQISGTKKDSSVVEFCTRLARYGYTAAAVTYRGGWNPLAATQPERALGLIQAAYRGVQDGRTAVRYFKKSADEDGNPYNVDSNKIVSIGLGTGGYLILGMVGLSDYNEIITTTNGPAKFILDANGDGTPETAMVRQEYHGDIEGKVLTIAPDGAFGYPAGDTTNYPNHVEYSSDFQLGMNVGGALGDISWLGEDSPPVISVQSAFDIFAPYDDAVLIVPTTGDPIVRVQGSLAIQRQQAVFGTNQVFIDANISDVYTDAAMANSMTADHEYIEGLFPVTNPPNSLGIDEGVVVEWWDPNALSPPVEGFPNGVPWNMLPHPSGGTFHSQGLVSNEGMSAEKARATIDSIFGYYAPRALATLELDVDGCPADPNNVIVLADSDVSLAVAPNPAGDQAVFTTDADYPMEAIQVFDMNGRLVRSYTNVNNSVFFMNRQELTGGMYVVKIRFEDGILAKKLMFK